MLGIIDGSCTHPIIRDARHLLFRARMHTLMISPDTLVPPYPAPLCGLLILRPEAIPDLAATVSRIRASFPNLPLSLFLRETNKGGNLFVYRKLADFVYDDNTETERLITDLFDAFRARGGEDVRHIAGGLAMERERTCASIFGLPILYTESEWMLLYYLLQTYPRAASIEEITAMTLRPMSKAGTHTTVSRISQINRKTEAAIPAYRPIENRGENRYALRIR